MDLKECQRCGVKYIWQHSGSKWLKMTYCSIFCEKAGLGGYTLEGILALPKPERKTTPISEVIGEAPMVLCQ